MGSVTVGADGRWNYTIPAPGLTEGPHNLSVTATDPVGNESAWCLSRSLLYSAQHRLPSQSG
ncbi:Ig-like domain-containing protein [Acinetobacter soli]